MNTKSIDKQFWSKVKKTTGCWTWDKAKDRDGYGLFRFRLCDGRPVLKRAHRYAFQLSKGPVDTRLLICHRCDNTSCVRPSHLFAGTNRQNQQDMTRKGRGRFGEKAGRAKLTDARVKLIRRQYATGSVSQQDIAKRFGVSQPVISSIIRRKNWQHI